MCFLGLGDHGGGPTEAQIAWLQENWNSFEGARLEFSSPQRFFDAVRPQFDRLPLVTGELQYHAIGCYTVGRRVKVGVRRAEHQLRQAEIALEHDSSRGPRADTELDTAWKDVVFSHFHDTLGGTCIPSAYEQVGAQLGRASCTADSISQYALRRRMAGLADDPMQRVVLLNASDRPFSGYMEIEPWIGWRSWPSTWRLIDEQGEPVWHQPAVCEAVMSGLVRLVAKVDVEPGQLRVLRIDEWGHAGGPDGPTAPVTAGMDWMDNRNGVAVNLTAGQLRFGEMGLPTPRLDLVEDLSDTWSHGLDRYPEAAQACAVWSGPCKVECGPVMAALVQQGRLGQSWVLAEYRVYAGEPFVELRLRVHWAERHRVLKLVLTLASGALRRRDGVLGGAIERSLDGAERPMRDWTLLHLRDGGNVAVVSPDAFALDATAERVRLTLLRSPRMAHHDPCRRSDPRDRFADQGEHEFRFRFYAGKGLREEYLDDQALMLHRRLIVAELTRGMKA